MSALALQEDHFRQRHLKISKVYANTFVSIDEKGGCSVLGGIG